jgi:ubiquitin thioesterase protein OTUB1
MDSSLYLDTDKEKETRNDPAISVMDTLGDLHKSSNTDQLTIDQMEAIRTEVNTNQPLIGKKETVQTLLERYKDNTASPGFVPGINYLSTVFSTMRQVRGDGNCFYRGFLFGYLENLLILYSSSFESEQKNAEQELARFRTVIQDSLTELISQGYPEFALESFHEV